MAIWELAAIVNCSRISRLLDLKSILIVNTFATKFRRWCAKKYRMNPITLWQILLNLCCLQRVHFMRRISGK
ncbi:hypothetical protein D3C81_2007430 [compost metagenome]